MVVLKTSMSSSPVVRKYSAGAVKYLPSMYRLLIRP